MANQDVFKAISEVPRERFTGMFLDNLTGIYEYNAQDIRDYLLSVQFPSDAAKMENLLQVRQHLHERLNELFPVNASKTLYNRRKCETVINDIFILGYSVVNKMEDQRLKSVFHKNDISQSAQAPEEELDNSLSVNSNSTDLLQVCMQLQTTVFDLTGTVSRLQDDIRELSAQLEQQQSVKDCVLCLTRPRPPPSAPPTSPDPSQTPRAAAETDVEAHSQRDTDSQTEAQAPPDPNAANSDQPGIDGADSAGPVRQEGAIPPRPNHQHLTGAVDETATTTGTSASNAQEFMLPNEQRRQAKRGRIFTEVEGAATSKLHISGIAAPTQPRSVYVGRLSSTTTCAKLRQHLRETGVTGVTDVIDLHCKIEGRSSFCIVVDGENDEAAIYNSKIWPLGAKIRPYRPKRETNQHHGNPGRANVGPRLQQHNRSASPNLNSKTPKRNTAPPNQNNSKQQHSVPQQSPFSMSQFPPLPTMMTAVSPPPPHIMQPMQTCHPQAYAANMFSNNFLPFMNSHGAAWFSPRLA